MELKQGSMKNNLLVCPLIVISIEYFNFGINVFNVYSKYSDSFFPLITYWVDIIKITSRHSSHCKVYKGLLLFFTGSDVIYRKCSLVWSTHVKPVKCKTQLLFGYLHPPCDTSLFNM